MHIRDSRHNRWPFSAYLLSFKKILKYIKLKFIASQTGPLKINKIHKNNHTLCLRILLIMVIATRICIKTVKKMLLIINDVWRRMNITANWKATCWLARAGAAHVIGKGGHERHSVDGRWVLSQAESDGITSISVQPDKNNTNNNNTSALRLSTSN